MHPALTLSGLGPVPAYELMLALGACVLVAVVAGGAARGPLPRGRVFVWLSGSYVAAIIGARAAFAAGRLPDARGALAALVDTRAVGFSSVGGLVAAALAARWLARRLDLALERLAWPLVLGGCLFGAVARVGCFLAGCCHGRPTALSWGVVYPDGAPAAQVFGAGIVVHPSPLYEIALLLGIAIGLARPGAPRTLRRSIGAAVVYVLARAALDVLRGDVAQGPSWAQCLAVALLVVGAAAAAVRAFSVRPGNVGLAGGVSST